MGFRRLSIIDLAGGDQPLFNEDKTKVLTFNGEIYNYQTLREELIAKGHTFQTNSDSEVLVHGYEEYGTALPNKLRGMFAFVIWDTKKKELFGARDYFGIKPLYYAHMNDTLMYGSEIKAFLPHPNFKKELNTETLENYLSFQYSPLADTFFKNVYKLMPAHYFLYKDGKIKTVRYWTPSYDVDESKSLEDWTDTIEKSFADSVEAHKIADVEVGSFLSSGIDSSYITAQAQVDKSFTVGFAGDQYNEIGYADECSDAIHINNKSKAITEEEYWDTLPTLMYHLDEPLGDPACIALYFVAHEASKEVKVCLSGEGADEMFGGYNSYAEPLRSEKYCELPKGLRGFFGSVVDKMPPFKAKNFVYRHRGNLEDWFQGNPNAGFSERERKALLKVHTNAPSRKEMVMPFYEKVSNDADVLKMQYVDMHMWLASDILLKGDKMSMANSLEVRVPFLDKELFKVARQIPTRYRVDETNTKVALRKAALRHLPEKTADKKKLGFPVPLKYWLKEDKYYNKVKTAFHTDIAEELFNTEILDTMLDDYREGRISSYLKIWSVYTFLVWYDEFFIKR
jgi:asparagine synthase (glutamine-hydrolysing)